jgi:hypothetical protein
VTKYAVEKGSKAFFKWLNIESYFALNFLF